MDLEPTVCRLKWDCGMAWAEIWDTTISQANMLFAHKKRELDMIALERENAKRAL